MDYKKIVSELSEIANKANSLIAKFSETPKEEHVSPSASNPEDLNYTELKKYAKNLGVSASGTREEILSRLNPVADGDVPEEDSSEVSEVEKYVNSLTQEELADILTEAGLSAKGKQPTLVARVLKAVEDGDIELLDEDEEDDEDEEEEEDSDFSDDGTLADLPDYSKMTEKRKAAVKEFRQDIFDTLKNGEFPRSEQVAWLQSYYEDKDERKKLTDKQVLSDFLFKGSDLIDNDGEIYAENLETLYEVGDDYFCCGRKLDYDEDAKTFTCPVCESEYEAE